MVYRGKPSAGCENCRKAKKRCGLEQPACTRCVKLKKICSGYRDVTQLQIQDESESVRLKAKRQRVRAPAASSHTRIEHGLATPAAMTSPPSDEHHSPPPDADMEMYLNEWQIPMFGRHNNRKPDVTTADEAPPVHETTEVVAAIQSGLPFSLKQDPNELAITYFFNSFTARAGHWNYLREQTRAIHIDSVLDLAIRACGMAALHNVQPVERGREYAQSMYAEAVGHVNAALRDIRRCKKDETLLAVAMLGYYENLTCDSKASVQSWKAHINGATQLLRVRGKPQLKSPVGRMLFRETRAQMLTHCIWEDRAPPLFFKDWEHELTKLSPEWYGVRPSDRLTGIGWRFAQLRSDSFSKARPNEILLQEAAQIELDMIQWSIDTQNHKAFWAYQEIDVQDSVHVWNGKVHHYAAQPAATVWNSFRSMRIMLTRMQELLGRRIGLSEQELQKQHAYFSGVRRQMCDDICATLPTQLGHADPAPNSQCLVITGYNSIWPCYFAATCALERIGFDVWCDLTRKGFAGSSVSAQVMWILTRLEYISKDLGIKWADGVVATLKGDFRLYDREDIPENPNMPLWLERIGRSCRSAKELRNQDPPIEVFDRPGSLEWQSSTTSQDNHVRPVDGD